MDARSNSIIAETDVTNRPTSGSGTDYASAAHGWSSSAQTVFCLILLLAIAMVYGGLCRADFVNLDDFEYVKNNVYLTHSFDWATIKWAFAPGYASNWHPVTWLSHWMDYQVFGLRAGWHHVINILLHAANSILLFFVLTRLTARYWESAFVAALFALHPVHVESVAWISERKDVLSTFFAFCSLWYFVTFTQQEQGEGKWWRNKYYWLSLFAYALAVMSKPMVVTLPFVMLLLDFWPLQRLMKHNANNPPRFLRSIRTGVLVEKTPFMLLSAGCCILTLLAQRQAILAPGSIPVGIRLSNVALSYLAYLRKIFWPVDLAAYYPYNSTVTAGQGIVAALVLALLTAVAIRSARTRPYLVVGWLWFLGVLVPMIGLVQVGSQAMADRYTYVSSIGIFIAVVWFASHCIANIPLRRHACICGTIVVASFACCAHWQSWYWMDTIRLFDMTLVNTSPNNVFIVTGMAGAMDQTGNRRAAEEYFERAFKLNPKEPRVWLNYGNFCSHHNEYEKSLSYFDRTIAANPNIAEAYLSKGSALVMLNRLAEAKTNFVTALQYKPDALSAELGLAAIYVFEKQFTEALSHYERALHLSPRYWRAHHFTGFCLAKMGRLSEATHHFQLAVRYCDKPDAAAWNDLAWMLAVAQDPSVRDVPQAIRLAQQACTVSTNKDPGALDTLAVAHSQAGDFDDAIKYTEQAIALVDIKHTNLIAELERRITLYRSRQPYHSAYVPDERPVKALLDVDSALTR
jgi:tetratricopeptide (TPR) repeat protein